MSAASLPTGLWDLTISRICGRASSIRLGRLGLAHYGAQAAFAPSPSDPPATFPLAQTETGTPGGTFGRRTGRTVQRPGPLTPRSVRPATGPLAEIERRVQELKEAANAEVLASETLVYSEEDLMAMYADLLAHPEETSSSAAPPVANDQAQKHVDIAVVRNLEQQLLHVDAGGTVKHSPLMQRLRRHTAQPLPFPFVHAPLVDETQELHCRVLQLANARLDRLQVLKQTEPSSSTSHETSVPTPLFSLEQYQALARTCVNKGDIEAAELALHLVKRSGLPVPEDSLTTVLHQHAKVGNVAGVEQCLASFLAGPPTEPQRHLHVKCHLRATRRHHIPESALAVLHSYEAQGLPAPMKTYTSTIAALYSTNLSIARAQAWDLFSHMRYVAHPKPDVVLYTSMIRACASPVVTSRSSDPERALDLWTEMTVEQRLTPTVGSYNAVILACAKSGRKAYVNEAFRIAKEMVDAHRDAYGRSAYLPDRSTLCALLEGAKRIGDLSRARWILADLVQSDAGEEDGVNEEIMMHVFHAYTSYVPPFTRNLALLKASPASELRVPTAAEPAADVPPPANQPSRFTHIPPQTGNEVIDEVQALFERILEDTGKGQRGASLDPLLGGPQKFKHVILSVRLVNSYLSVHYQHSSLEVSEALFWKVFNDVGVVPDARSYLEALERCARSKKRERDLSLQYAERLWENWLALEDAGRASGRTLDARMVERAHVAFIRVLALNGQLQRALDHVKSFVQKYPPSLLYERPVKPSFRSTRTALVGARPLIRLTSHNEVPDDRVSPLLTFDDLELLHHRLVAASMRAGIGYIKYISKAYEWALRGRRDAAMKARPAPDTHAIATA